MLPGGQQLGPEAWGLEYNAVLAFRGTDVNNYDWAMATPSKAHLPGDLYPLTAILPSWTAGPPCSTCQVSTDWHLLALHFILFGGAW